MIPSIAERKIHQVLTREISFQSFEEWLYEDNVLESSNPDLYLELISFDYNSEDIFKDYYDGFARTGIGRIQVNGISKHSRYELYLSVRWAHPTKTTWY